MVLSYIIRSRRWAVLILGVPLLCGFSAPGAAQDQKGPQNTAFTGEDASSGTAPERIRFKEQRNVVFTDLNAPMLALFYLPTGIEGYGLELGYERILPGDRFSGMVSVKYLHFSLTGALFEVWNIGLYGRYLIPTERSILVTSVKLGALIYDSPYYGGSTFLMGLEISWKHRPGRHFMLEPYIGCDVSADDRYIIPFTVSALTEFMTPGLNAGLRLGIGF
ncbi:MAG: hypothetical protein LBO65_08690 [Spirochaetaceae bacterium]|jgi:hypothetical protein|nr:hypothetical protein [Spirochaetaceae bacterium]